MYAAHKKKISVAFSAGSVRYIPFNSRYGITYGQRGLITSSGNGQVMVIQ